MDETPPRGRPDAVAEIRARLLSMTRNTGMRDGDRALNFVAAHFAQAFTSGFEPDLRLATVSAEPSLFCPPERRCLDVVLSFFNPARRHAQAGLAYRLSVDVSDAMPVFVGELAAGGWPDAS